MTATIADRIGAVALRLAKDDSYRHRAAEELLAIRSALAAVAEPDEPPKNFTDSPMYEGNPLCTGAQAAQQAHPWLSAVQLAYGYLWHVNNEPMAPVPLFTTVHAAYMARQHLRGLLTNEERGKAINAVRGVLENVSIPAPKSDASTPPVDQVGGQSI